MEHLFKGQVINVPVDTPAYATWLSFIQRLRELGLIFTSHVRRRLRLSDPIPTRTHLQVNTAVQSFLVHDSEGAIDMFIIREWELSTAHASLFDEITQFYKHCLSKALPQANPVF